MPVRAAAQVLGLTERQVWRLLKAYRLRGADGLISKKRGQPSNRRTPDDVRLAAMAIVKERYADFGPTLAAEKLREQHGLTISRETLRAWMLEAGLWADRQKRRGRVYQPRYRRECVGELVQVDGSASPRRRSTTRTFTGPCSREIGWTKPSPGAPSGRCRSP
jgi:transposase